MLPESVFAWPVLMRPFNIADAPRVQELAGDRAVSSMTAAIPHPYPDEMAEEWIDKHPALRALGSEYIYAITRAEDRVLVGAIALRPIPDQHENLGYWIGHDYWGNGYATAAARALIALGFKCLDCQQVTASHLVRNPASGRVLEKCGFVVIRRESRAVRGRNESLYVRGLTRDAWERVTGAA